MTVEFNEASNNFQQAAMSVGLVCGEGLEMSLLLFAHFVSHLAETTGKGGLPQASTMPTVQRFGKVQLLSGFVTEEPLLL